MQKTLVASDKRLEQTKMPLMLSANILASMMLFSGFNFITFSYLLILSYFQIRFFPKFSLISKLGMMLQINSVHTVIFFKIIY